MDRIPKIDWNMEDSLIVGKLALDALLSVYSLSEPNCGAEMQAYVPVIFDKIADSLVDVFNYFKA